MLSGYSYQDYIVSFVDILCFKNMCGNYEDNEETINKKCNNVLSQIEMLKLWSSSSSNSTLLSSIFYADNAIRLIKTTDINTLELLKNEITELSSLQKAFSCSYNLWLRGAIVKGKAFYEEQDDGKTVCFGPAINRAHIIENGIAVFPRIVIDNLTLPTNSLQTDNTIPIRIDFDGLFILDYLQNSAINQLRQHKQYIQNGVSEINDHTNINENHEKIMHKYSWLKSYHNSFVKNKCPLTTDLIIT
jgi:hypothetical protein